MMFNVDTKIFVLLLLIVACTDSERTIDDKLLTPRNDTLKQDISFSREKLAIRRNWARTLGLSSIENGSSNPEIRIWQDIETRSGRLVIIKKLDASWGAELIKYRYYATTSSFPDSLAGDRTQLSDPRSGWTKFLNKLLKLEILTLPDYKSLPHYFVSTDEPFVTVEIGKAKYYRSYEYPNPYERKNFESAKKMVQFLELLKKEFSLP